MKSVAQKETIAQGGKYLFPNERIKIPEVIEKYVRIPHRPSLNEWLAKYSVPLIQVGHGKKKKTYVVHLWDLMDAMEREKQENQQYLCRPQK